MPYMKLDTGTELYYQDQGEGQAVVFVHGVMMSSKFFERQFDYFKQRYRTITFDLRGHGQSSKVPYGHTVANYAKDLKRLIERLGLSEVILVGWSMGAFVIWDYFNQFGSEHVKAVTIVDQSPSDYLWDGWEYGAFNFEAIKGVMQAIQEDQRSFNSEFIYGMFKEKPDPDQHRWILEEMMKLPAAIASTIVFNQTAVDYRETLSNVTVPTLICFGRDDKFFPVAAGEYIQQRIPGSKLVAFENSSHCLFLEEPDAFNRELDSFFQSLK
ncbi:alpha/beta fold hydrolase [Sediminibacillus dalangtanensis]|uniref:Alpha/beta fold hydrolase n=1 Tax=Sediminibacillus dalangtanensis TaxID=2729421 RepID=A0ABX7VY39_9BACI|nr:alpha/beta hydrolase [Sediminibacillus dalangtanensis]QTN00484.1 alpha/beta fold hydrolase [Sediminibacillus dalangtanensis]